MNLISRLFNPAETYSSALGANIFEPRPPDAPRSSLEGFLADVAECVQQTPSEFGCAPDRKPGSLTAVELSSTPLMKPLGPAFSSPRTPESQSTVGYVRQHALPRIGTWKSTERCNISASSDSSSPDKDLGGRSESNDQSDLQDDKDLLSDYYDNLTKLHAMEERLKSLEDDMRGMEIMQKTRHLLGQQPLFIDLPLWDRHRQSLNDRLEQLRIHNQILRSHCIKRGLLLLPNPSAFSRSASVSTGQGSGRTLPQPTTATITPLKNRGRSATLPVALIEQAVSNHRSDRKRIPRPAKAILEYHFSLAPQPTDADVECLAQKTGLPMRRVRTWFITKRALCKENGNPP